MNREVLLQPGGCRKGEGTGLSRREAERRLAGRRREYEGVVIGRKGPSAGHVPETTSDGKPSLTTSACWHARPTTAESNHVTVTCRPSGNVTVRSGESIANR